MATTRPSKKLDIPSVYQGNTWKGMTIRANLDLTGWRVKMWVAPKDGEDRLLEFDSDAETIEINPGTPYSYIIWPPMVITLRPGLYKYDAVLITDQGVIGTKIEGVWEILKGVTK